MQKRAGIYCWSAPRPVSVGELYLDNEGNIIQASDELTGPFPVLRECQDVWAPEDSDNCYLAAAGELATHFLDKVTGLLYRRDEFNAASTPPADIQWLRQRPLKIGLLRVAVFRTIASICQHETEHMRQCARCKQHYDARTFSDLCPHVDYVSAPKQESVVHKLQNELQLSQAGQQSLQDQVTQLEKSFQELADVSSNRLKTLEAYRQDRLDAMYALARTYKWIERSPEFTAEYDEVRQVKREARELLQRLEHPEFVSTKPLDEAHVHEEAIAAAVKTAQDIGKCLLDEKGIRLVVQAYNKRLRELQQ